MPEHLRAGHRDWRVTPPLSIARPDDPDLPERVSLSVGPAGTASDWAAALKGHRHLRYLSIWAGYTTQPLFDSIASIGTLERLALGYLRARDIAGMAGLKRMEYLSIVSLSAADTLAPIGALRELVSLSLGISKKIGSLDSLVVDGLPRLRALVLGSSSERPVTVESLSPLASLPALEYLFIGGLRPRDKAFDVLAELPALKAVQLERAMAVPGDVLERLRGRGVAAELH